MLLYTAFFKWQIVCRVYVSIKTVYANILLHQFFYCFEILHPNNT